MPTCKPPDRDGLSASAVALPPGDWLTIVDFLVHRFAAIERAEWLARIKAGDVLDEHGAMLTHDAPYRANGKLFYYRRVLNEARIPFEETVLFQDDWLVVADKPHFLPVTPSGRYVQECLLVRLKRKLGISTLAPMHRIDRDTAGLVLFTVQPHTRDAYQRLFRERAVDKRYEAIAPWHAELALPQCYRSRLIESVAFMQMRETSGTVNAETDITLLEVRAPFARYGLHPLTGQKHQLRVHMNALGIPIVHDRIYPQLQPDSGASACASAGAWDQPLQLLAKSIAFTDPLTNEQRSFESRRKLNF